MNKELYKISVDFLQKAYKIPSNSVGSTQWSVYKTEYNKEALQVLAIPGTNGIIDWFWNFLFLQKDGVKYGSYVSAQRILKTFIRTPGMPLLITCHSKSGPTGIYLQELLCAEYCVAFCPSMGFTDTKENHKTVIFIDDDDVVVKIGWSRFVHRITKVVVLPRDKKWWDVFGRMKDHLLTHIEEYINKTQ